LLVSLSCKVGGKGRFYLKFNREGLKVIIKSKRGYLFDELTNEYVHRLIYKKRHGRIEIGMHIHHIDSDKLNNKADNLVMLPESIHMLIHKIQTASRRQLDPYDIIHEFSLAWLNQLSSKEKDSLQKKRVSQAIKKREKSAKRKIISKGLNKKKRKQANRPNKAKPEKKKASVLRVTKHHDGRLTKHFSDGSKYTLASPLKEL